VGDAAGFLEPPAARHRYLISSGTTDIFKLAKDSNFDAQGGRLRAIVGRLAMTKFKLRSSINYDRPVTGATGNEAKLSI